ncbi:MAG: hypothetical protein ACR2KJ_18375 [Jatrophihabitans sp.]
MTDPWQPERPADDPTGPDREHDETGGRHSAAGGPPSAPAAEPQSGGPTPPPGPPGAWPPGPVQQPGYQPQDYQQRGYQQRGYQPQGYPAQAYPVAGAPLPWAPPPPPPTQLTSPAELRDGAAVVVALAVIGVLAGVVWKFWTVKTHGYDIGSNIIIPDETEGWIGADAHFAIITGIIGLIAGPVVWRMRRARGATMAVAIAVGGLLGSLIAARVGHLIAGGNHTVQKNTNFVDRLPVAVHAHGLLVVEAVLALATYLAAALFTARDDLGVPVVTPSGPAGEPSAVAEHGPEGLRRDGYGVGGGQQRELPPQ